MIQKGLKREVAYAVVQDNAMESWRTSKSFKDLLAKDKRILKLLKPSELKELFDPGINVRNINHIFQRAGIR